MQAIVLRHEEEGREGGEVEKQQNLSWGVDSALRNGPEVKMPGTDSRKSSSFSFNIPQTPHYFQLAFSFKLIVLRHGEEGEEGGEVEEQRNLSGGVDSALRNSPESKMLG